MIIILPLTLLGVYEAVFSYDTYNLDRLGALGSWIGGFTALIAVLLAFNEYSKSQKREAFTERYHMVCKILPEFSKNWRDYFIGSLEAAVIIKIYQRKLEKYNKFKIYLAEKAQERDNQEQIELNSLKLDYLSYFENVVSEKIESNRTVSDALHDNLAEFQDYFNKIRFSSNYYFQIIESDFDSFKKLVDEAIAIQKYIYAELDNAREVQGFKAPEKHLFENNYVKSSLEKLIKDINLDDYERNNSFNSLNLTLKSMPTLMNTKKDFFLILKSKLEINSLNLD